VVSSASNGEAVMVRSPAISTVNRASVKRGLVMSSKSKGIWLLGALAGTLFIRLAMSLVVGGSLMPVIWNGLAVVAGFLSTALVAWVSGRWRRSSAEPPTAP
jgi:hypothetical protein